MNEKYACNYQQLTQLSSSCNPRISFTSLALGVPMGLIISFSLLCHTDCGEYGASETCDTTDSFLLTPFRGSVSFCTGFEALKDSYGNPIKDGGFGES